MSDRGSDPSHEPFGRGLVLFRPGTPPSVRRGRQAFLVVFVVIGLAIIWPIYPLFAGFAPRIVGLPLFFAWVLGALMAMFLALVVLFVSEAPDEER